jgi:hypothetical protein
MDSAKDLLAECQRLRDEIARLRQVLIDNDVDPDPVAKRRVAAAPAIVPSVGLTTPQKIELFRSLFRGRDDVYAARWESPDGRHGYSPVAQRDWKAYSAASIEDRKRSTKRLGSTFRSPTRRFTIISRVSFAMKPAGSSPSTSTRSPGRRTLRHS